MVVQQAKLSEGWAFVREHWLVGQDERALPEPGLVAGARVPIQRVSRLRRH